MSKNFTQYILYSVQHFFENILIQLFLIQLLNRSLETSDDDLKNLKGVLMGSSRSSSVRQVYMDGNSFNKAPQSTIHCVFLSHNWWIVTNWTSRNSSVPAAAAAVIFYSDHDVTMQKKVEIERRLKFLNLINDVQQFLMKVKFPQCCTVLKKMER